MNTDIQSYNDNLRGSDQAMCEILCAEISRGLPKADNKVWHGHPVWFINGNPIVGYAKRKNSVQLLFWSGQSFDEPGLAPEGSFKAAEAKYTHEDQINFDDIKRWLTKAEVIQWDYKNIVKKRGQLDRL